MKTAVITDSNSGIPKEEAEKFGIFIVPMPVIIDGKVYYEGKDLTQEQFYAALTGGRDVSTSQPSPGEVMDLWNAAFERGYDEIVYLPMSAALSESCNTAKQLAEDFDGRVQVVDNRRVSVTQRLAVMDALYLVQQGHPAREIRKRLEEAAYEASIYIALDTLEFLKKGGRITAAAAALGSVLHINPIMAIQGGVPDAVAKVRGMKKCGAKMIQMVKEDIRTKFGNDIRDLRIMTAETNLSHQQAEEWRMTAAAEFPGMDIRRDPLSFSLGCHIGPGAAGIGVCRILGEPALTK